MLLKPVRSEKGLLGSSYTIEGMYSSHAVGPFCVLTCSCNGHRYHAAAAPGAQVERRKSTQNLADAESDLPDPAALYQLRFCVSLQPITFVYPTSLHGTLQMLRDSGLPTLLLPLPSFYFYPPTK